MTCSTLFKRVILRVVLRNVSLVIRLVSVSDQMELTEFHEAFRAILGWSGHLDYIFRVHGQEFNSFRRITRSKALCEFQLHRQEKFVYICDTLDLWEWDVRVLDIQAAMVGDCTLCLGGRGAPPAPASRRPRVSDHVDRRARNSNLCQSA
jgi:hypothetical protein